MCGYIGVDMVWVWGVNMVWIWGVWIHRCGYGVGMGFGYGVGMWVWCRYVGMVWIQVWVVWV